METETFKYKHIMVDKLFKKSYVEKTEKVYIINDDGSRDGPYLRKSFHPDYGLGKIYVMLGQERYKVNACKFVPHIYSVYDDDGYLIVFEEYIEGQTLSDYIKTQTYSEDEIYKLFSQLCQAVKFLHKKLKEPVIHRDIKPENILVTNAGDMKLIDFGISRKFDQKKESDTFKFGTVGYASPEHFGYQQTDERSDVFSMGKVLEFLYDKKNWKQKSEIQKAFYDQVIEKACSIDPNYRYQNVDELLKDFQKASTGGSIFDKLSRNKTLMVLGTIWNVLLTIVILFLIFVSIYSLAFGDSFGEINTAQRIIYGLILVAVVLIPIWIVFTYKPSLRKLIKNTPKLKFWQYIIFIFCCGSIFMLLTLVSHIVG